MGLVDKIKQDVKKSGQNKSKFMYFREGTKTRVRFLTDMDDGMEITFHDSFQDGINVPCKEAYGKDCEYCDQEGLRTRSQYVWSVWDYEAKEVKLLMFPVNNCTPVPALMSAYETYGILTDRDYVISVQGKQQNKTFSVLPMDKEKFRNTKAKPYSNSQILKMIAKAWPWDDDEEDEYEDDEPKKKRQKKQRQEEVEDDFDDDWGDDEDESEDDEVDYDEMSPKELYDLCKERGIDVKPKKPKRYYVKNLEDWDAAQDEWGDDDEDDEWEDEDE